MMATNFSDLETQHQFPVGTRVYFQNGHLHSGHVGTVMGFQKTLVGMGMRCSVDGWCNDTMVFRTIEVKKIG